MIPTLQLYGLTLADLVTSRLWRFRLITVRLLGSRLLGSRLAAMRRERDRGDVAEKIVIVGIFVLLAIAVGMIITRAVTGEANNISHNIISTGSTVP